MKHELVKAVYEKRNYASRAFPVIKAGKDYISSPALINRWMLENDGKEIFNRTGGRNFILRFI